MFRPVVESCGIFGEKNVTENLIKSKLKFREIGGILLILLETAQRVRSYGGIS
jgi:hypothetical protein